MRARSFILLVFASTGALARDSRLPTSLRIVDAQGVEVIVANARIDYDGLLSSDVQTDGIRLQQGDGAASVKWSTVDTIRVVSVADITRPPTVRLQVVLRNGVRRGATLVEQGHMQLLGQTDLGDYAIDLHKVRLIVPVR
jgi:hypothetical protein